MFGLIVVALGLSAFWYARRIRMRDRDDMDECASEGQIPSQLLIAVEQAVLASATTGTGLTTIQAGQFLASQNYPCNGVRLAAMGNALDAAPIAWKQSISFAATSNVPQNMVAAANQIESQGGSQELVAFVNLAAVYMVERNRLGNAA